MALSVSANGGGNGLANLFRQARPVKLADDTTTADQPTTAVSLRPVGRSGIDSTGSGTAQMSAALTQYMSKFGGLDEAAPTSATPAKSGTVTNISSASARSGAADLMRVLDAYGSDEKRLTA